MTWRMIVEGHLPSMNEYIALERSEKGRYLAAREKREKTEMIFWVAKAAALSQPRIDPRGRYMVRFIWVRPDRRQDLDGVCGYASKLILDGLVMAGVIENDTWRYIVGLEHRFMLERGEERVIVELRSAETH